MSQNPSSLNPACLLGLSALGVVVFAGVCDAQVTAAEASCRSALASTAGKYVKKLQKAMVVCHKSRNKGSLDSLTDCNDADVADSKLKAADAAVKLHDSVVAKCTATPAVLAEFERCPAPYQAIDDGAATAGIDDWEEMIACELAHLRHAVETLGVEALGLPGAGLTSDQQKCHSTIAKELTRIVNTTAKIRAGCQKPLDSAGGPLDFACATSDPVGKIAATIEKSETKIAATCASDEIVTPLDSCTTLAVDLPGCLIGEIGEPKGGSIAAMPWGWTGVCPGTADLYFNSSPGNMDVDLGWTGLGHDIDPTGPFDPFTYNVSCDADCANCVSTGVSVSENACRCKDDLTLVCSDNVDCAGAGGECRCYMSPPIPVDTIGLPLCMVVQLTAPLSGSLDVDTGEVSLSGALRLHTYSGISHPTPCPVCVGGTCEGGDRDGLACTADGSDLTFGLTSYDCPPLSGAILTGANTGQNIALELSTGSFSLPFALPCDPPDAAEDCACSTCTLDDTVPCNGDADCAAVLAGTCRTDGAHGGESREPNSCTDGMCSADPGGDPDEGVCLSDTDSYCDGLLRADGSGLLICSDNADCDDWDGLCPPGVPGGPCGTCSVHQLRNCFLDPIAATGTPWSRLVGGGCAASSVSVVVNSSQGWPGPFRYTRGFDVISLCPDGVTRYAEPDGFDCP